MKGVVELMPVVDIVDGHITISTFEVELWSVLCTKCNYGAAVREERVKAILARFASCDTQEYALCRALVTDGSEFGTAEGLDGS